MLLGDIMLMSNCINWNTAYIFKDGELKKHGTNNVLTFIRENRNIELNAFSYHNGILILHIGE